jgi:hypothetical protein
MIVKFQQLIQIINIVLLGVPRGTFIDVPLVQGMMKNERRFNLADLLYEKMYRLTLTSRAVEKIANRMLTIRKNERITCIKNFPTEFFIVYCNCSDGDITNDSTCDGYYDKELPQVIFIDPQSQQSIGELIAHEIIHDIQRIVFGDFDLDTDYSDRWQEKMAYELEEEVSKWIRNELIDYHIFMEGSDSIDDFLFERKKEQMEAKIIFDLELEEKIKPQQSLDDYFAEKLEEHNW